MGSYFRSRPQHAPSNQDSSVNVRDYAYSETRTSGQEESENTRRTAEKGKKRARDDDDDDDERDRKPP